jgi:phosphotransferase system enzyme I (PtsI)
MDEISTSPVMIPEIKKIIRSLSYVDAQEITKFVMTLRTGVEIVNFLKLKYQQILRGSLAKK